MRVMVTGAGGMLADAIGPHLAYHRDETLGMFYTEEERLKFQDRFGKQVVREFGPNLRRFADFEGLLSAAAEFAPDWIFHCAAWTDVEGCQSDPERAWRSNALATLEIALVARESGARLLYVSTDYVFDGNASTPYKEDAPPSPLSEYGRTKLWGERFARYVVSDCLIVRTAWMYGPTGKNFVDTIRARLGDNQPVRVVNDQRGSPTRATDLAIALRALAASGAAGIVNVANGGSATWYEIAVEIASTMNKSHLVSAITTAELGLKAPRPRYSVLDTRRYFELTGLPLPDWRGALHRYLGGGTPLKEG